MPIPEGFALDNKNDSARIVVPEGFTIDTDGGMSRGMAPKESFVDKAVRVAKDAPRLLAMGVDNIGVEAGQALDFMGAHDTGRKVKDIYQKRQTETQGTLAPETQRVQNSPIYDETTGNWDWSNLPEKAVTGAIQSAPDMAAALIPSTMAISGLAKLKSAAKIASAARKMGVGEKVAQYMGEFITRGVAGGGVEGIQAGLGNAAQTEQKIRETDVSQLQVLPSFQAAFAKTDSNLDDATRAEMARDAIAHSAALDVFIKTAPTTGALGVLTGGGATGMLSEKMAGKVVGKEIAKDARKGMTGFLKNAGEGFTEEAAQEGAQSPSEQYIQNKAEQRYLDPTTNPMAGVVNSAVEGAASGGVMGLAGGGMSHFTGNAHPAPVVDPNAGPLSRAVSRAAAPVASIGGMVAERRGMAGPATMSAQDMAAPAPYQPNFTMQGKVADHVTPEVIPPAAPLAIAHTPQVIDTTASEVAATPEVSYPGVMVEPQKALPQPVIDTTASDITTRSKPAPTPLSGLVSVSRNRAATMPANNGIAVTKGGDVSEGNQNAAEWNQNADAHAAEGGQEGLLTAPVGAQSAPAEVVPIPVPASEPIKRVHDIKASDADFATVKRMVQEGGAAGTITFNVDNGAKIEAEQKAKYLHAKITYPSGKWQTFKENSKGDFTQTDASDYKLATGESNADVKPIPVDVANTTSDVAPSSPKVEAAPKGEDTAPTLTALDSTRSVLATLAKPKKRSDASISNLAAKHGKETVNELVGKGLISFPGKGMAELTKKGRAHLNTLPVPLSKVETTQLANLAKNKKRNAAQEENYRKLNARSEKASPQVNQPPPVADTPAPVPPREQGAFSQKEAYKPAAKEKVDTPLAVVAEAVKTAKEEGTPLKEQKKYLLSNIDDAIKAAPDSTDKRHDDLRADLVDVRSSITGNMNGKASAQVTVDHHTKWKNEGKDSYNPDTLDSASKSVSIANETHVRLQKEEKRIQQELRDSGDYVTIHVPDDGTFEVYNTKKALSDFKEKVAKLFPATETKPSKTSTSIPKPSPVKAEGLDGGVVGKDANGHEWHTNGHLLVKGKPSVPFKTPMDSKRIDQATNGMGTVVKEYGKNPKGGEPVSAIKFVARGESLAKKGDNGKFVADSSTPIKTGKDEVAYAILSPKTGDDVYLSQTLYVYAKSHHPNAEVRINGANDPVKFVENGKVVATVMPVRGGTMITDIAKQLDSPPSYSTRENGGTLSLSRVQSSFPKQTVTEKDGVFTVTTPSGVDIRISKVGTIEFDRAAAAEAYGREILPNETPVAEFKALPSGAVINLTERGVGELDHEIFHASMSLALNDRQRAAVLKSFGTEEKAAAEYQRLKDDGSFEKKKGHLFLRAIYDFFRSLRQLVAPTGRGVMEDVASGKVWGKAAQGESGAKYSSRKGDNAPTWTDLIKDPTSYPLDQWEKIILREDRNMDLEELAGDKDSIDYSDVKDWLGWYTEEMDDLRKRKEGPFVTDQLAFERNLSPVNRQEGATGDLVRNAVDYNRGVKYSLRNVDRATASMTAEQKAAVEAAFGTPPTAIDRLKEFRKDIGKNLTQGILDQYAPIKELSMEAYIKARMTKGADSTLEAVMLYGKPYLDNTGSIKVEFDGKNGAMNGFAAILSKLDGEHDRFLKWVAGTRAARLKDIGLENLMSKETIAALKTLNQDGTAENKLANGENRAHAYSRALNEMNAYNDAILKVAVERGLVNDATRQMYKDMPYIPFYRLQDEGVVSGFTATSGLVNQTAWKKLKGGTNKLNDDMLANMLRNWSHLITASARNDAAKATLTKAVDLGAASEVPAGYPGKGIVTFRENTTKVLKKQADGNYRRVLADPIPDGTRYTEDGVSKVSDGTVVPEFNVERHFIVSDPHMLDAITSIGQAAQAPKFIRGFKNILSHAVTINPTFKIRNLIRDSIASIALADLSYNPAKNIKKGYKLTAHNSETRAQMMAGGGIMKFGSMLDGANADNARKLIDSGVPTEHILDSPNKVAAAWKKYVVGAFDAYQEFGDRGEQVNRAALYQSLIEKGYSADEAAFWARDLMDFSMSGKWAAVRFLSQTVPFMNARLQGMYKLGRSAKADKKRFATVIGGVAMASLALLAAYHDDDDWQRREDWDRDNYWWFKVGNTALRIPKPFEIGAIGSVAEWSAELMFNKEMTGKRFAGRMRDILSSQLSMNPTPQVIKPMIDLWANKDSFTNRPIEGMGMDRIKKEDRYNERTSGTAKLLGQLGLPNPAQAMMGRYEALSPLQIDSLVRGYFSWLGVMASTTLDYGIFKPLSGVTDPAPKLKDVFLVGNFVETLPSNSSRYVSQMYESAQEIEQSYNSYRSAVKSGDTARAKELMETDKENLAKHSKVEHVKESVAAINSRIKKVMASKEMSAEEKRTQIDALKQRQDKIAKEMVARGL